MSARKEISLEAFMKWTVNATPSDLSAIYHTTHGLFLHSKFKQLQNTPLFWLSTLDDNVWNNLAENIVNKNKPKITGFDDRKEFCHIDYAHLHIDVLNV